MKAHLTLCLLNEGGSFSIAKQISVLDIKTGQESPVGGDSRSKEGKKMYTKTNPIQNKQ